MVNTGKDIHLLHLAFFEEKVLFFPLIKKNLLNCFVYPFISDLEKHEGLCASR